MIILFCYLALISLSVIDNARGPVYPDLLQTFSLTPFQGSFFFTISSITGLITSILAHRWLKIINTYDALKVSMLIQIIGTLLIGLSATFFESVIPLYLGSMISGFSVGGITVCMNLLVTEKAPQKYQRSLLAGLHSVYALSSFIAPFLITHFLQTSTWDQYFIYINIFPAFLIFWMLIHRRKVDLPKKPEPEDESFPISFNLKSSFGIFLGLCVMAEVCISSRMVFYLKEGLKWETEKANFLLSLFFIGLFLGRVTGAILPRTLNIKNILLSSLFTSFACILLGIHYHPYFLSIVGFTIAVIFPYTIMWITEEFPQRRQFLITSCLNFVGLSLILMHVIFGSIANQFGIATAINLPLVAIILAFFFWFKCYGIIKHKDKLV